MISENKFNIKNDTQKVQLKWFLPQLMFLWHSKNVAGALILWQDQIDHSVKLLMYIYLLN
jgi:hypothetical protein